MAENENDSKYWRGRAAEARAMADQMRDHIAKGILLEIAESYDRIAQYAEGRGRSAKGTDE
jgi:hypothetical protein